MKRRLGSLVAVAVAIALLAGCGGDDDSAVSTTTSSATAPDRVQSKDLGRVVALGEEFLLADVLALGVTPVASTATVAEAGFQGLPAEETEGIEALSSSEPNFEQLANMRPDTLLVPQYVIDVIGRDELDAIGDVSVIPDELTSEEQLTFLGDVLGRSEQADTLIAELEAARDAAAENAGDCNVSVATIYPGPAPAAWIAEPNIIAGALLEMGCTLRPSADDVAPDGSGRVYLSMEQLGQLSAPQMILLQNDTVEGEADALATIEADPIWKRLPAVQASNVEKLDRLGYPGARGRIALYDDLAAILDA
jgi:iron complex transport system substrate-binding protein